MLGANDRFVQLGRQFVATKKDPQTRPRVRFPSQPFHRQEGVARRLLLGGLSGNRKETIADMHQIDVIRLAALQS